MFNISLGCLIAYLSIPVIQNLLSPRQAMNTSFDPLRLVNTYGAFGRSVNENCKYTALWFDGSWYSMYCDTSVLCTLDHVRNGHAWIWIWNIDNTDLTIMVVVGLCAKVCLLFAGNCWLDNICFRQILDVLLFMLSQWHWKYLVTGYLCILLQWGFSIDC